MDLAIGGGLVRQGYAVGVALLALSLAGCPQALQPQTLDSSLKRAIDVVRVGGAADVHLVRKPDAVSLVDKGTERSLTVLGPLDAAFFARSGRFYAVSSKTRALEARAPLALYDASGTKVWTTNDAPTGAVHVADDGKTVVALNGRSFHGTQAELAFLDATGAIVKTVTGLGDLEARGPQLAPDGGQLVLVLPGGRMEGGVSIDDRIRAYDARGTQRWEKVATDLHFAGQLVVLNDRVVGSFYRDSGRKHSMLVYDRDGAAIKHVTPMIANRGAYRLRMSPDGTTAAGFGHHHLVVFDVRSGAIAWEWEWIGATPQQDALHDCTVESNRAVVAVGYRNNKSGRRLLRFDHAGQVSATRDFTARAPGWGDPRVRSFGGAVLLLDAGDNRSFAP